ncbi:NADH pyrophosphatase [compost metagenome]
MWYNIVIRFCEYLKKFGGNINMTMQNKDYASTVRNNLKEEYRHMPLILPGAAVAVVDFSKGKILLQERTDNGTIGMLGGGIGITETFEQCAVREVFEESGLIVEEKSLQLFKVFKGQNFVTVHPNEDVVIHINWAAIVDFSECTGNLITRNAETKRLIWTPYDEVASLNLFRANRPMLEEIVAHLTK